MGKKTRCIGAQRAGASSYVWEIPNVFLPGPNEVRAKNDSETQLHFISPGEREQR